MNKQPHGNFQEFTKLYGISLIALLLAFGFLLMFPEGRWSLTLPDQNYQHPWDGSDIMGYVDPARNFLETGTFGRQPGVPDLHRTIGYPAFLASVKFLFGDNWVKAAYSVPITIFALLFPCNIILFRSLFPNYWIYFCTW